MLKRSIKKTIPSKPPALLQEPHLLPSRIRNWGLSKASPVYRNYKKGHPIITISKIKGEIQTLGKELEKFISSDRITVRSDLEKILVKGDYKDAILNFFKKNKI
jgi:hypothetical protein